MINHRTSARARTAITPVLLIAAALTTLPLAACASRTANTTASAAIAAPAYPATAARPVTDTFHSVAVTENYRWLEDPAGPGVKDWIDTQNALTRSTLNAFPGRAAARARVQQILAAPTTRCNSVSVVGGVVFAVKTEPPKQQPFLVVRPSLESDKGERILLDPNTLNNGATTMDWFVPSPDGKLIAASLSTGGTESGDVFIYDVQTGKRVHESITRVHGGTAGGSLAWHPDSKGFYYTRYPRAGERPEADMDFYMQLYAHRLGQPPERDTYEIGKDFPRIAEITVATHRTATKHNGTALTTTQKGDGGEFELHLRTPDGKWSRLATYEDRIVQAEFGPDDALYLISRKDAPRGKLLRLSLDQPSLANAKLIVPESKDTLVSGFGEDTGNMVVTKSRIFAVYQLGGPSEIRAFDHDGKPAVAPKLYDIPAVGGLHPHGDDGVIFSQVSYINPLGWFAADTAGKSRQLPFITTTPVSFDSFEVVREMATSKDGTQVPVNIIRKKGIKLDGSAPALLTAYGGYGISIEPAFRPATIALLEQGFVWAQANIRGGGEFGDAWHRDGALTKKQNVFDDFQSAAQHLIKRGYTNPKRLAIEGGSNGGLLMGASLVQRPDLFKAVVSHVGIYDMLRVELSPNGAFNVPEFGTVKDPAQFKALYAYSPYHNVKDGVTYPATLFLTGMNDPRVDAMQSRKMTARMQAASPSSITLLRTSYDSGHGMGTPLNERVEQAADVNSFLFWQLAVEVK